MKKKVKILEAGERFPSAFFIAKLFHLVYDTSIVRMKETLELFLSDRRIYFIR